MFFNQAGRKCKKQCKKQLLLKLSKFDELKYSLKTSSSLSTFWSPAKLVEQLLKIAVPGEILRNRTNLETKHHKPANDTRRGATRRRNNICSPHKYGLDSGEAEFERSLTFERNFLPLDLTADSINVLTLLCRVGITGNNRKYTTNSKYTVVESGCSTFRMIKFWH